METDPDSKDLEHVTFTEVDGVQLDFQSILVTKVGFLSASFILQWAEFTKRVDENLSQQSFVPERSESFLSFHSSQYFQQKSNSLSCLCEQYLPE